MHSSPAAASNRLIVVDGDWSPHELNGRLTDQEITHAAVVQGSEFLGLIRLSDLQPEDAPRRFSDIVAGHPVLSVDEQTPLAEVGRLLLRQQVDALPVMEADGSLRGIATLQS